VAFYFEARKSEKDLLNLIKYVKGKDTTIKVIIARTVPRGIHNG
jgi:hypothetical protein